MTAQTTETTAIEPVVAQVIEARPAFEVITTPEEAIIAADYLKMAIAAKKKVKELTGPGIKRWHEGHRAALDAERKWLEPVTKVETACRGMLGDWQEAEQRRQREEQARLDREARQEALRQAREAGDKETHQAVLKREIPVVSTQAAAPVQRVTGVSTREYWTAEVTDLKALVKAVASGACPLTYIEGNAKALNATMRASKGQMQIPGVRAVRKTGIAAR